MAGTNKNICEMKDMKWFLAILVGIFALWYMNSSSCSKHVEYMKHALSDMSPMEVEGMKTNERAATVEKNAHENPTRCMNSNWVSSNLLPKKRQCGFYRRFRIRTQSGHAKHELFEQRIRHRSGHPNQ